ncbi:MAG: M1 family metallopeptidase [Flavobacteriales bacterium]|nr:M1 family metallopeptidase [Flavobacteriales bacterium]
MRAFYLIVSFILFLSSASAQDYFQQEVNYNITVSLDDVAHSLTAFETLEYINNSSDTLHKIYFHIWPNAYRNNQTALGHQKLKAGGKRKYLNAPHQQGWIDSLDFKVDGQPIRWEQDTVHIDICVLHLNTPLLPDHSIEISTPFYVKLPKGTMSRLGHLDEAYQITQWYPKPAVYDKNGWHAFPYLDIGEFYSEYGSFDVSITVPENYVLAATGNLQNEEGMKSLEELAAKTEQIVEFDTKDKSFPSSATAMKTLRYTESDIHDFAWFADKRFHVLQGEVVLPHSGRKVKTWVYFPNHEADLWKDAIEYMNDAVYYYSLWYGDYPYSNCSAVHAPGSRGGMEYPTVTIIGNSSTAMQLETVVMHEVGHNWFYGILGSNERDDPWMDEGINTFSEMRYFDAKYPDNKLYPMQLKSESIASLMGIENHSYSYIHQLLYRLQAKRNMDLPTNSCSEDLAGFNYSAIAYSKTGLSFYYLKDYLGDEKFDEIMQAYFEAWKFKHPSPEDLRQIFEKRVNEDLDWFFDDLLSSSKKLDYKIARHAKDRILIKNKGDIESPVLIKAYSNDSVVSHKWLQGFEGKQWVDWPSSSPTDDIRLFGSHFPDINPVNDRIKGHGLFKKIEPLRIKPLGIVEDPERSNLNILPVPAWNYHNGFMLGASLHNDVLPLSKFEYQILPLYSFGTNDLAGLAELDYHIHPSDSPFQRISFFLNGRQFAYSDRSGDYYQKVNPGMTMRFDRKTNNIPIDNEISLDYIYASSLPGSAIDSEDDFQHYVRLQFEQRNADRATPHRINLSAHGNSDFVKGIAEFEYKHTYIYSNSMDIRFFAGAFLYRDEELSSVYDFYASGTIGANDYLYEDLYLARGVDPSDHLFVSNQFSQEQGGLASLAPFGSSEEFMIALNLASSLPITKEIPIQFYANAAYVGIGAEDTEALDFDPFLYEGGVKLHVLRNVFEFYFPLAVSKNIQDYQDLIMDNYWQRIRFTFNFGKLNIRDLAREI